MTDDTEMDEVNNAIGRAFADSDRPCEFECSAAASNTTLMTLPPADWQTY